MRDWIVTLVLAIPLTVLAVAGLGVEREIWPIGITFAMCLLVCGALVRVVTDTLARRKRRGR